MSEHVCPGVPLRKLLSSVHILASAAVVTFVGIVSANAAGLSERLPNSTLNLPQQPLQEGYVLVNAFGANTFSQPLCIRTPPGETNRVFVLEKGGRIQVVTNIGAASPVKTQYIDLRNGISTSVEQGLLGLAFHPQFQVNGYFFVYRSVFVTNGPNVNIVERLARFQAVPPNAPSVATNSEVVLFDQIDLAANHNGGDLHFGSDGYLYISLGDGGNQNDTLNNSQTIRKGFHSGLLRIDVDNRPGNLPAPPPSSISQLTVSTNYSVPADNPWVTNSFAYERNTSVPASSIRTEFWAVGLRNPWRFFIDPVTDMIWLSDVGGGVREEVNIITKGGNYGWVYREGILPGPTPQQPPANFSSIDPIYDYAHGNVETNAGNSITGGVVYHGTNLTQQGGAYIFADYVSGWIWSLRYNGSTVSSFQNLLQNGAPLRDTGIAAFGIDPRNGDVLLADVDGGVVRRLVATTTGVPLPPTLADTGTFSDLQALAPQAGIVPYDVNVPFWSDNAVKRRWFSVPNTNLDISWNPTGNWTFPTGTVWIKHFELVTNYVTQERTRLETRLLVRNPDGVYGATYRWGGNSGNATLVPYEGLYEPFVISDASGIIRTQSWYYPGRSDCITCHSTAGGLSLGFHTAQLNRNHTYTNFVGATGETDNQLRALAAAGYFNSPMEDPAALPALANWDDTSASVEWRSRSYLAANCVQCHQPGGMGLGAWDARYQVPTDQAGLVWGILNNNFGNPNAHVITPRSVPNSMLYQRMAGAAGTRMPPLATSILDTNNMNLIAQWIGSLSDFRQSIVQTYTLINTGAVWRFNDDAIDLGTAWRGINYPDGSWRSGPAELGFGDGGEGTLIRSNQQWTTYIRRSFTLADTTGFTNLAVRLLRDDGAVVYLNDVEVFRSNMPTGSIVYSTPASGAALPADESTTYYTTNARASLLAPGTNVLAVELHQNSLGSSDLSFNFQLIGTAVVSAAQLTIAPGTDPGSFILSWPLDPGFFDLYSTSDLTESIAWTRVTDAPAISNQRWTVALPFPTEPRRFYRLQARQQL